ncbi:energy transducer TonB [Wenzhouxiangella sp. AB-CW3]|uniref:energy transducer TonB n=1 Tax=Wenzhouxiangella sp. AB-CW3 TaxID=2771012 RepID=UPI00168A8AA0|nr:energy transducer TonB [Wenzhouxiangella sp. AB-CW3]QOC22839.1 energy transducer TonB [Wenzhouxiangella sp. AB-CW3]
MSTILRLLGGIPGAVIVTVGLFLLLATVITQRQDVDLGDETAIEINVTRQIEDRADQRVEDFQRPVLDQPPPPPPMVTDTDFRPTMDVQMGALPDLTGVDVEIGTGFDPDRDAQPLVRIPPQYPTQCIGRAQDVETVMVEFDVTPEGNVVDPRVLDTTNPCFNRAAMRAVQRWRYNPRVVDGVQQPRTGVRTAIDFALEE